MTDVPSTGKTLAEVLVGIPGAGRRTLLAAMPELAGARFPENFRLCVLDAERMDSPAQIALLDELAAEPGLELIFALNKADRITGPRTVIARTLALLRERGFHQPRLYPSCAAAARLFGLPAWEAALSEEELSSQGNFYYRFGPGENSLSAFSVVEPPTIRLGSREVTPEQLRLALENTGVPALAAVLETLRLPEPEPETEPEPEPACRGGSYPEGASAISADSPVGCRGMSRTAMPEATSHAFGRLQPAPPEAEASETQNAKCKMQNEETEDGENGSFDSGSACAQDDAPVGTSSACPPSPAPAETPDEAAEPADDGAADEAAEAVGAVIGRPPEEAVSEMQNAKCKMQNEETEDGENGSFDSGSACAQDDKIGTAASADAAVGPAEASDDALGAVTGRPPEAAASEEAPSPEELLEDLAEMAGMREDEDLLADIPCADRRPAPEPPAPEEPPDVLAVLLAQADGASCAELLDLARAAGSADAPAEARDKALDQLHEAYNARQLEELDAMTAGAEDMDLESLRALTDRINRGPYTVRTRMPYTARLNARIDELQSAALAELCKGVEEADSRSLARIRQALERTDCADVLKSEHFRRIEARQEELDLEALERVTAGAENMSDKELRAVAVTLEANNWNPKYAPTYRHKIELLREVGFYREVQDELKELDDMERRELLELRERLSDRELPARFTVGALDRIEEKIYRLDLLRLAALNNDFDRLDFEQIDELRAQAARGDYCDRAKSLYLGRLLEREKALILENTSARAELARQIIAQNKLRVNDFLFASGSEEYERRLAEFWGGTGLEQPRDVPVFLFDNGSQYAMTATRFYFKAGKHLDYVALDNVDHFQVMRQHLSLMLQIVGKDDSYRLTEAKISRLGADRTLDFLNECLRRWAEPGPAGRLAAELRVAPLKIEELTAPVPEVPLRPQTAARIFCESYRAAGLREGNLVRGEDENSQQRLAKLRQNFGLRESASVLWYESASRLGPVKEGVALGAAAIYRKEAKEPLRTVPLGEIFSIRPAGSRRMSVTTLQNEQLTLPVSDSMTPLIDDYVKAIQLGEYLQAREAKL